MYKFTFFPVFAFLFACASSGTTDQKPVAVSKITPEETREEAEPGFIGVLVSSPTTSVIVESSKTTSQTISSETTSSTVASEKKKDEDPSAETVDFEPVRLIPSPIRLLSSPNDRRDAEESDQEDEE